MKTLSAMIAATGFAAVVATAGGAGAAPLGAVQKTVAGGSSPVETVDYRGGYRHCHWHQGRKWCHGGVSRYDGYRPGVYLRFGYGGDRHRHHNRRHWR